MYSKILVRFGELSTKGKNKMTFVRKLASNIKELAGGKPEVIFDRIFLDYSEDLIKDLQYVFGIYSYSPVLKVDSNKEAIKKGVDTILKIAKGETFKVITKRHWKGFESNSNELNGELGGYILSKHNFKVDVKNPNFKVEIEIRKDFTYIFVERIKGLGGLPTGIHGKVLHLMSGGIDSPMAAFELMKRGVHIDYLNFITPPHTDEKTVLKVSKLVKLLNKYQGKSIIYRVNYTDALNLLGLSSNQSYKINLMRRSFYRIADQFALKNGYLGLSNGENLGQVASQTLESINTIGSQATLPIYRPILTADKIDTINKARKIGTYEISIEKAEETCELFAPKSPITKPNMETAQLLEKELKSIIDIEKECIKNIQIEKITK